MNRFDPRPLLARVVIGLFWLALPLAPARAADHTPCALPRPQDQVWLVSQRGLGCDVERGVKKLQYWRYDQEKKWVRSNLAELEQRDDPQLITTVFVHGNRIDWCEAFTKGWQAYRTLVNSADERPVRFVIWSWPSDAVHGPVQDAREKAYRTNPAAYYLAWFLDRLNPDAPVSLWAHSFGSRIVTGALHILGGGQIGQARLAARSHENRQPVQVVLVVAALDNDWLLPGRFHGLAMSQVSSMLLVTNCSDALLKRYHLLYGRRCCQQALGFTGPAGWADTEVDRAKVARVEASSIVGRQHQFINYICAHGLVARMRPYLLFEQKANAAAATEAVAGKPSTDEAAVEETDEEVAIN